MKRETMRLTEQAFDVLIVGGGITGAGVALDAATRGLRVALIDRGDFASGTSSVSSKLVHGGLRYLEHGDFRLVYEALHERRRLLHNAPHLVWPLRFVLPFYSGTRVAPWKWRLGLLLYDLLAGTGNLSRSQALSLPHLYRAYPGLRRQGLRGGAAYFDAQMDDARLCLEVVRTAVAHGAVAANYVEAVGFERRDGQLTAVQARDHLPGRDLRIVARQILNATGPWSDHVRCLAGDADGPRLRPTRGVHLIVPDRGLTSALLFLHPADGRVFFVIPWLGKTLIGTTDTECNQLPDHLSVTDTDRAYLLEGHNHYLEPHLETTDVLGSFVGLRPLMRADAANPSALSREFQVFTSSSGLVSVVGGKYTTYRHMAEVITDLLARRLGGSRPCRTKNLRLDGAPPTAWKRFEPAAVAELHSRYGLEEASARHLVCRYGSRAGVVAEYAARDAQLRQRVLPWEPDLRAEFVYQREQEMAQMPADFLLRRTHLGLFYPDLLTSAQGERGVETPRSQAET